MALPSFLIIGAMKSATSTLWQQLAAQPGIFMPQVKEPNFFSDDARFARGLGWYQALFADAAPGDLLGEASTHYTKLPTYPLTVPRLRAALAQPKLIYVMRHPIDRLVSQYIHQWSEGEISCTLEEAVERHPELVDYGCYARQLAPYFEAFGAKRVLPVMFADLQDQPQRELARVCRFIGHAGEPKWRHDLAPANVSAERVRKFPLYDALVESELATRLRRGLIPKAWRTAVRTRLTMRQRPTLSAALRERLEARFDADLAGLADWLGREVTCANFAAPPWTGARSA